MSAHRIASLHLELAQLEHEQAQAAWQAALDGYVAEARKGLSVAEVTAHKTLIDARALLLSARTRLDSAMARARCLGISTVIEAAPEPEKPTAARAKRETGKAKP